MKRRVASTRSKRQVRLLLVVGLVWGCATLLPPMSMGKMVFAQSERKGVNVLDTKRNTGPSTPRPKADEEVSRVLRDALGRDFGPNSWQTNFYFIAFFIFLAAVVGLLVYYDIHYRQRLKSSYEDPGVLFQELCAAHELTRSEKRFLKNFADRLDLDDPLPLFIEPNHFLSVLENGEFAESRPTIRYFLEKLFDLETDAPPDSGSHFSQVGRRASVDASTVYRPIR